jgi:hypothetical protein
MWHCNMLAVSSIFVFETSSNNNYDISIEAVQVFFKRASQVFQIVFYMFLIRKMRILLVFSIRRRLSELDLQS